MKSRDYWVKRARLREEQSTRAGWQLTADMYQAYETALKAGFQPKTAPKVVPLDSWPEKMTFNIAFVIGNDGEELEFFKQI